VHLLAELVGMVMILAGLLAMYMACDGVRQSHEDILSPLILLAALVGLMLILGGVAVWVAF
jgi:hypothetical protein